MFLMERILSVEPKSGVRESCHPLFNFDDWAFKCLPGYVRGEKDGNKNITAGVRIHRGSPGRPEGVAEP